MSKTVVILPKYEAPEAASKYGCNYMISIQDAADKDRVATPEGIVRHIHLYFDDLSTWDQIRPSFNQPGVMRDSPPKPEHIEAAILFWKSIPDGAKVAVHCFAGISRSSAMATILLAHDKPMKEDEAMAEAVKSAPFGGIWPNKLMIEYGDKILKAKGRLIQGVEDVKANDRLRVQLYCKENGIDVKTYFP